MVNSVNRPNHFGRSVYEVQVRRAAWREQMLNEIVNKMREISVEVDQAGPPRTAGPPVKGRLLDRIV